MNKILFIGLGHMGLPMAINLRNAGFNVYGFDVAEASMQAWQEQGGKRANNILEAQDVSYVITMLQTADQVRSVCTGSKGLFASMTPGSMWIDCSSIDVISSRSLHEQALSSGLMAVDAPVSGGVKGAMNGSLTFMVGGAEDAFCYALPVLQKMGKNIIHAGPAGNGQLAKICNNMILGVSMIVVSESLLIAQELGIDLNILQRILDVSSGSCWVIKQYFPLPEVMNDVPANNAYKPGFSVNMMLKDLKLGQMTASQAQVETPMGALGMDLYEKLAKEGLGDLDFSVMAQWLKQQKEKNHV